MPRVSASWLIVSTIGMCERCIVEALSRVAHLEWERRKWEGLAPAVAAIERGMVAYFTAQKRSIVEHLPALERYFSESAHPWLDSWKWSGAPYWTNGRYGAFVVWGWKAATQHGLNQIAHTWGGAAFEIPDELATTWAQGWAGSLIAEVDQYTKTRIGAIVADGIEHGDSYGHTAKRIVAEFQQYAVGKPQHHIASRAHGIAVTEAAFAYEQGQLAYCEGLSELGIPIIKGWEAAGDERDCEPCDGNAGEGMIPLDSSFGSGATAPPEHPYCRCWLVTDVDPKAAAQGITAKPGNLLGNIPTGTPQTPQTLADVIKADGLLPDDELAGMLLPTAEERLQFLKQLAGRDSTIEYSEFDKGFDKLFKPAHADDAHAAMDELAALAQAMHIREEVENTVNYYSWKYYASQPKPKLGQRQTLAQKLELSGIKGVRIAYQFSDIDDTFWFAHNPVSNQLYLVVNLRSLSMQIAADVRAAMAQLIGDVDRLLTVTMAQGVLPGSSLAQLAAKAAKSAAEVAAEQAAAAKKVAQAAAKAEKLKAEAEAKAAQKAKDAADNAAKAAAREAERVLAAERAELADDADEIVALSRKLDGTVRAKKGALEYHGADSLREALRWAAEDSRGTVRLQFVNRGQPISVEDGLAALSDADKGTLYRLVNRLNELMASAPEGTRGVMLRLDVVEKYTLCKATKAELTFGLRCGSGPAGGVPDSFWLRYVESLWYEARGLTYRDLDDMAWLYLDFKDNAAVVAWQEATFADAIARVKANRYMNEFLHAFKGSGYESISAPLRAAMREGRSLTEHELSQLARWGGLHTAEDGRRLLRELWQVFNDTRLPTDTSLVRYARGGAYDWLAAHWDDVQPGLVFGDGGVHSTGMARSWVWSGKIRLVIRAPKGTAGFPIEKIWNRGETEWLMPWGMRYRVLSKVQNWRGYPTIEVEVVDPWELWQPWEGTTGGMTIYEARR